jgi:pyruvate formate lyase activating enzyme
VAKGLKNVFVSNGYQSAECVEACRGLLHAANIDLKAFRSEFYRNECKARLQPVLDTLQRMRAAGVWLEITTLLIPGRNDDTQELRELTGFIVRELSPEVPWHVSAYSPRYKYSQGGPPPTPIKLLEKAAAIGREAGLMYVYAGNVPGHSSESTPCPNCGHRLIGRQGFSVFSQDIKDGACPICGQAIAGVWG